MWVLVTFGTRPYAGSLELLRHSALSVGFDRVVVYTDSDVPAPVGPACKGYGSYSWKPGVILRAFREQCVAGDTLVYCDATMRWLKMMPTVTADVSHYRIGDAEARGYTTAKYTKPACLEAMAASPAEKAALQLNAAVQAYRVGPTAEAFLQQYADWCGREECVGDDAAWPLHRHDQSILTLLSGRHDSAVRGPDLTADGHILHHRRLFRPMATLTVVTPTTGAACLERAMASVQRQQVVCLRHLVVCDGPDASARTAPLRKRFEHRVPVTWLDLPFATGRGRWNGHRMYAAAASLAPSAHGDGPSEYVAYLDEDNWYADDHLRLLLDRLLDGGLDAAFSLRMIHNAEGEAICPDCCESLGNLAPASAGGYFLADTSAWLLTHRVAVDTAACWDVRARDADRPEADRALTDAVISRWRVDAVRAHSLHYTAGSSRLSVGPEYFQRANALRQWRFDRPTLYLFHFSAEQTAAFFALQFDPASHVLDEWNQNQPLALHAHYDLVDGFAMGSRLPHGATVLIHMCQPDSLPLELLRVRSDMRRLLYTAESPNIRHRQQWTREFLRGISDDVLTYWQPILTAQNLPFRVHACPHNCHHIDLEKPADMQQLRKNTGAIGSIGMVLENRRGLEFYEIDAVRLQCLDGMRQSWARRLGEAGLEVTVHGKGWTNNGPWNVGSTRGKYNDVKHAVDILQQHSATLVVENCSANGYMSEKVADALMAGSVPIFFNGHETDLPRSVHFNLVTDPISCITPSAIEAKRCSVYKHRMDILARISSQAYAGVVRRILT